MAALEDTLKKIYGLPESTTPTMPRIPSLRRETGAVINDADKERIMTSLLRRETGAVVNDSEIEMMDRMYFPQPGDTVEIANQKAQALEQAIQQMEQEGTPQSTGFLNRARGETGAVTNDAETAQAIEALTMELQKTQDPEEQKVLMNMIENTKVKANAPYAPLIAQLSAQSGEDDMMAHVRSGDVNVSREILEANPQIEDALEKAAIDFNIDPETMVYGTGIASLDVQTGAEQHGFLKKLAKGIGKVVKKVAPIAMFIPGVGTALGGVLGGIGGLATSIPGIGGALGTLGSTVAGGIAKLGIPGISSIAGGTAGGFGGITGALTSKSGLLGGGMFGKTGSVYAGGPAAGKGLGNIMGMGSGTQAQVKAYNQAQAAQTTLNSMTSAQKAANPTKVQQLQQIAAGGSATGIGSLLSGTGGGLLGGGQGGGMLGGLGSLAQLGLAGGIAGKLGQMAYDEAKDQKGVSLSPVVAMDATGRYNLEAEIARRMGQQAPNPTEFGLLPANTFPELSGGQPRTAAHGGAIMAYAQGGDVSVAEYNKMNGSINGEGTETSDDIPAMLSDGEFVMTGQAVRGAGSYDMNNNSGILTLTPSGDASRDTGTDLMYQLMEAFSSQAQPA